MPRRKRRKRGSGRREKGVTGWRKCVRNGGNKKQAIVRADSMHTRT